jgi:uncharacterized membrane protein
MSSCLSFGIYMEQQFLKLLLSYIFNMQLCKLCSVHTKYWVLKDVVFYSGIARIFFFARGAYNYNGLPWQKLEAEKKNHNLLIFFNMAK